MRGRCVIASTEIWIVVVIVVILSPPTISPSALKLTLPPTSPRWIPLESGDGCDGGVAMRKTDKRQVTAIQKDGGRSAGADHISSQTCRPSPPRHQLCPPGFAVYRRYPPRDRGLLQ